MPWSPKGTLDFGMWGFLKLAEAVKPVLCFHSPESCHCWGQSPVKQSNPDSQDGGRPPPSSSAVTPADSPAVHQRVPMCAFRNQSSLDKSLKFRNMFMEMLSKLLVYFTVKSRLSESVLRKGGVPGAGRAGRAIGATVSWAEGE